MPAFLLDLKHAFRSLRKAPSFTIPAVLTLALGIGALAGILGLVDNVLLRPQPFPRPENLVQLNTQLSMMNDRYGPMSLANFRDLREQAAVFESTFLYQQSAYSLSDGESTQGVAGLRITPDAPKVLGLSMHLGRPFTVEEERSGGPDSVILSYSLWRDRYGEDPAAIGRSLRIGGVAHTIVGVLPRGLRFPVGSTRPPEVWLPLKATPPEEQNRGMIAFLAVGRLRPGVSTPQLRSDLARVGQWLQEKYPQVNSPTAGFAITAASLDAASLTAAKGPLLLLQGAVFLLWLIVVANVACLLEARRALLGNETALRQAIGAQAWDIFRRVFAESLLMALAGGLLGVAVTRLVVAGITSLYARQLAILQAPATDARLAGLYLGLILLTAAGVGAVPALRAAWTEPGQALKEAAARSGVSLSPFRSMGLLVMAEVALSLMLLVGAGLLHSFRNLMATKLGFEPAQVQTFRVMPSRAKYPDMGSFATYVERLLEELRGIPGVESVGAVSALPFSGSRMAGGVLVDGVIAPPDQNAPRQAEFRIIPPGYLETLRMSMKAGRRFGLQDHRESQRVAIVNEAFVQAFWPGQQALGRTVSLNGTEWMEVVGVVGNIRSAGMDRDPVPTYYFPLSQAGTTLRIPGMDFVVRSPLPAASLTPSLKTAARRVDTEQAVFNPRRLEEVIGATVLLQRITMTLVGAFAMAALALSAVGLYGVLSYLTEKRQKEMGIRMAIGAHEGRIVALVMGQGLRLTALGLGVGLAGALALGRVLKAMLHQVQPGNPWVLLGAGALLAGVAALACLWPALLASRVDPATALRDE